MIPSVLAKQMRQGVEDSLRTTLPIATPFFHGLIDRLPILIYPMNALASDQAGRIAKIIWHNSKLKGQITAGLFVGQIEHDSRLVMGPDSIITNKKTLRLNPPDILLTNYKMLDYLLIRPKDFKLWQHNGPETLRFLVVDELHTFDGAQGTDLACLVRRLKARHKTPQEYLCCIGTSATLGCDQQGCDKLREYAQILFGEPFEQEAIITKTQISASEFLVLKILVDEGVLEEQVIRGDRVWGIKPSSLWISRRVLQLRCHKCGHNASVEASERVYWDGAPCQGHYCHGYYQVQETQADYYGQLYATGDVQRIFAAEHTGLLPREGREDLERRFKAAEGERKPWDPNLLSCTSTLEMGIDIGNLSSVILCSVPPAQTNYLQRIGRAGRRDGNALNLTKANAKPHDLYFFTEPEEMISGKVDTPGIFLNASALLERQFTAFCFDRWAEAGLAEASLPSRLKQVLGSLDPVDEHRFPHNFLRFIKTHQTELFEDFTALFKETLSQASKDHLLIFIEGDQDQQAGLRCRIMEGLYPLQRERESLKKKVRTLSHKIRNKEQNLVRDKNYEQELNELKCEKSSLQTLIRSINDRNTFNFFTDEGLIPNYAFPEAEVVLRSIIYRYKGEAQEEGSKYETWLYEYERSAVAAIGELAPTSNFYAGGRKVQVDQINLALSEVQMWRLCNNCSHLEMMGKEEEKPACPRCGSTIWSDEGQKRPMLRMTQVFATTSDRESRISDEAEDREPRFYNKQMLVDFEDRHITGAFRLDREELPFVFEFLSKAVFREINFGQKGESGENVVIAGVELPRKGFTICRLCGKVQSPKGEIRHALTCTVLDQDADKNLTDCIYLYREFTSEAIRILLPVTTLAGSERKLQSFIAALQLGLKRKFGGNISHLQVATYEEPVPNSAYRKKYLILYDMVPGGTGYLKQLMRSEQPLMEVFERSNL